MTGICLSCKTFKYRLNTSLYLKKFASLHSQVKEFLSLVSQLFSLYGLVRLLHVDGCFVILELILGRFRLVQRKQERKTVVSFTTYGFLSSRPKPRRLAHISFIINRLIHSLGNFLHQNLGLPMMGEQCARYKSKM